MFGVERDLLPAAIFSIFCFFYKGRGLSMHDVFPGKLCNASVASTLIVCHTPQNSSHALPPARNALPSPCRERLYPFSDATHTGKYATIKSPQSMSIHVAHDGMVASSLRIGRMLQIQLRRRGLKTTCHSKSCLNLPRSFGKSVAQLPAAQNSIANCK